MLELMKWLQGLGVGILVALVQYLQAVPVGDSVLHGAIIFALVRGIGWLLLKFGPKPAPSAFR